MTTEEIKTHPLQLCAQLRQQLAMIPYDIAQTVGELITHVETTSMQSESGLSVAPTPPVGPVAEEVVKALRELADGYFRDQMGEKQDLGIYGRTMRESIVAQALARLSARAAGVQSATERRCETIQECIAALDERVDSLVIMCDRAGYTREGSDLSQRVVATRDAIDILRRLNAATDRKAVKP